MDLVKIDMLLYKLNGTGEINRQEVIRGLGDISQELQRLQERAESAEKVIHVLEDGNGVPEWALPSYLKWKSRWGGRLRGSD